MPDTICSPCGRPSSQITSSLGGLVRRRQPCSDLHASGRRFDTVRAHQCYSISGQRCSLAVRPTRYAEVCSTRCALLPRCWHATDRAEVPLDLASPTATPTTTPTARSGRWSWTPDIRSPWPDPTWTPWSPDTRRAGNWDIDIEVEVGIDDIRDPNRQPRIDVHGRRWRKFAYNRSEVPVHARRARWRWWGLGADDRW